jgi:hypothetical protein
MNFTGKCNVLKFSLFYCFMWNGPFTGKFQSLENIPKRLSVAAGIKR